jgi:hypothetical protein
MLKKPRVQALIAKLAQQRIEKLELTAERVRQEIAAHPREHRYQTTVLF